MLFISHILFHKVSNVFAVNYSHLSACYTYVHGIIDTQVTIVQFVPIF